MPQRSDPMPRRSDSDSAPQAYSDSTPRGSDSDSTFERTRTRTRTRRLERTQFLIDIVLDASFLMSSTLPASSSTSNSSPLSSHHPRQQHPHRHRTRRLLLHIIHAGGILIDIELVASFPISSRAPASSWTSNPSPLSSYHPRRPHPHGHLPRCVLISSGPPASSSTTYSSRLT